MESPYSAFSVLQKLDAGKLFAKKLASIKYVSSSTQHSKVDIPEIAWRNLDGLLHFRESARSVQEYLRVTETPGGVYMLSLGNASKTRTPTFRSWLLEKSLRTIKPSINIRAVQTNKFWGVKVKKTYSEADYRAWLDIMYHVIRAVQAIQLHKVEDRLLAAVHQDTFRSYSIYRSDTALLVDLLAIPTMSLLPDSEHNYYVLSLELLFVYLQELSEGKLGGMDPAYGTQLNWLFNLFSNTIADASGGVLVHSISDPNYAVMYHKKSYHKGAKSKNIITQPDVHVMYADEHNSRVYGYANSVYAFSQIGVLHTPYSGTFVSVPGNTRYFGRCGSMAHLVDSLLSRNKNPAKCIKFFTKDRKLSGALAGKESLGNKNPVTLGISIGLEHNAATYVDRREANRSQVVLYPVIRLELQQPTQSRAEIIKLRGLPKIFTVEELM